MRAVCAAHHRSGSTITRVCRHAVGPPPSFDPFHIYCPFLRARAPEGGHAQVSRRCLFVLLIILVLTRHSPLPARLPPPRPLLPSSTRYCGSCSTSSMRIVAGEALIGCCQVLIGCCSTSSMRTVAGPFREVSFGVIRVLSMVLSMCVRLCVYGCVRLCSEY